MNKDYVYSGGRVFVTDESGLNERTRPVTEEELLLENELEILEKKYEEAKKKYLPLRNRMRPGSFLKKISIVALAIVLINTLLATTILNLSPVQISFFLKMIIPIQFAGFFLMMGEDHRRNLKCYRQKLGLEEKIHYLEDEISSKKKKLAENSKGLESLPDTPVQKLENKTKQFTVSEEKRLDCICYLGEYRDEIIKHYNEGTLDQFLASRGLTNAAKEAEDYLSKRLTIQQVSQSK